MEGECSEFTDTTWMLYRNRRFVLQSLHLNAGAEEWGDGAE